MVSAPDVITYVGVPLAVFGVLPIFYTCIRAIITLRSIRHALKINGLGDSAIIRGSLMSGITEVEIPRRRIAPLDRELDPAYWALNPHQISLPGGTWAIFMWNQMLTGRTLYRCQYKEDLRVPPAEINFEELVAFLLDRGAIPDAKGWKILKSIGLWTPTGTILLRAPTDGAPVLRLAPPYDGDGILRLAVFWKSEWDQRNVNSLPPFWMQLQRPTSNLNNHAKENHDLIPSDKQVGDISLKSSNCANGSTPSIELSQRTEEITLVAAGEHADELSTLPALLAKIDEMKQSFLSNVSSDGIRFHAEENHVPKVYFEHKGMLTGDDKELWGAEESTSQWFACAASALSQKSNSGLWNVSIPPKVATFSRTRSIPGGVMVLLEILGEDDVPPFAGPPPQMDIAQRHRNFVANQAQLALERQMPPAQAEEARRQRMFADSQSFHNEHMQLMKTRKEYEEQRAMNALNSHRLDCLVVAEASRLYLIQKEIIPSGYTLDDLAKAILYLMVLSREEARLITEVLDQWLGWSQHSGLKQEHLQLLRANKISFCYASCLLAIIQQADRSDSRISSDMFECLKIWQTVHLG